MPPIETGTFWCKHSCCIKWIVSVKINSRWMNFKIVEGLFVCKHWSIELQYKCCTVVGTQTSRWAPFSALTVVTISSLHTSKLKRKLTFWFDLIEFVYDGTLLNWTRRDLWNVRIIKMNFSFIQAWGKRETRINFTVIPIDSARTIGSTVIS